MVLRFVSLTFNSVRRLVNNTIKVSVMFYPFKNSFINMQLQKSTLDWRLCPSKKGEVVTKNRPINFKVI